VCLQRLALQAPRPVYTVMRSDRGALLPTLASALERYVQATGGRRA
jgi:hypothetical protein